MATKLGSRFDKLSAAAGISNIGDGVMGAAFPLLVASLTRDPLLVAGATFVGRLPWFLFALLAGALVDRMDRKSTMVITDGLRAIGVGLLAWGVMTENVGIPLVYAVAFGLGVAETFFDTSAEALTPRLLGADLLPAANGRLQAFEWVGANFIGPPIGAFLFALTASLPFFVDAFSFVAAALLIAWIPGSYRSERLTESSVLKDVGEGLRWLWGQRVLRTLVLMAGVTNLFVFGIIAIFVLFAQDILGLDETGYGLFLSVLGVGGLVGAIGTPRVVGIIGPGNALRVSVASSVVLSAVFGVLSNVWLASVMLAGWGAIIAGWNVVSVSLRQSLTPDELRGRVSGAARLLAWGSSPLGAVLGGALAAAFGLRAPFLIAAGAFLIMAFLTWRIISNESIEGASSGTPSAPGAEVSP